MKSTYIFRRKINFQNKQYTGLRIVEAIEIKDLKINYKIKQ